LFILFYLLICILNQQKVKLLVYWRVMTNGLSNFEVLKQKISTLPQDDFPKGRQPRVGEVLIVDDEEGFVLSLADGLSAYRKYFNLRTAPNGAEAVKILKLSPIDLVITDLSMPKMDGFELLAYMNRNYPKIPVILMTAFGTPKIEEIVSNMGIFRYLEKPLDINSIADNIFDALGIKTSPLESKTQVSGQRQKTETQFSSSAPFGERTDSSATDVQTKIAIAKKVSDEEKSKAKLADQSKAEMTGKSKSMATFGSRTSLSVAELGKMREDARMKSEVKPKDDAGKRSSEDAEKKALEAAEKRAILEVKAKAEAERFAREEAQRKAKEAEERAKQEALAREDAEMRAKAATKAKAEAEERADQEALAREDAERRAKAATKAKVEAEERARQEALAREDAAKKVKAEAEAKAKAEAEERASREALAREDAAKKAKTEAEAKAKAEAEERADREALAREEDAKKAKAEAEAEERTKQEAELKAKEAQNQRKDKSQKDLKTETKRKLSAWKKS
jgi:CheY-like chemotaxis protein